MARFTIEQIERADRERRCRERELNKGLRLIRFTSQDRQAPVLDTVVYRLEFPQLYSKEETLKL